MNKKRKKIPTFSSFSCSGEETDLASLLVTSTTLEVPSSFDFWVFIGGCQCLASSQVLRSWSKKCSLNCGAMRSLSIYGAQKQIRTKHVIIQGECFNESSMSVDRYESDIPCKVMMDSHFKNDHRG